MLELILFSGIGVEYDGSTYASGAYRLGSIPSTPTKGPELVEEHFIYF